MSISRINLIGSIAVIVATTLSNVTLAASNGQDVSTWHSAYGWEWSKIPTGTKIRILIKFDQPTYLCRERDESTRIVSLPEGGLGEYLGKTKDGWVQISTAQGKGWVDERLLEPAQSAK